MTTPVSPAIAVKAHHVSQCQWRALVAGVAALVVCAAAGLLFDRAAFFRAYLAAYIFFLGLSLGSMAILLIYHLTGGGWGFLIRRILEAQINTLPLLAILFIPLALGTRDLYLWAQPAAVAADERLQEQQFYLNEPFFWIRAAIYFSAWLLIKICLSSWSRAEERTGDRRITRRVERSSGLFLVLYGLTLHFSAFDWVQSLESTFHSTIFPPIVATGQILSAYAFSLIIFYWLVALSPQGGVISTKALNDLGNLLLSFLIIWGYLVWFQYMLIWIGNLPADIRWYLLRTSGGWQWVTAAFVGLGFVVPFFLLLFRSVKRSPRRLAATAIPILCLQLVYAYYEVMPAFPGTALASHWIDFLTPIAIGGIWFADFLYQLQRFPLLPERDFNRPHALHSELVETGPLPPDGALSHA